MQLCPFIYSLSKRGKGLFQNFGCIFPVGISSIKSFAFPVPLVASIVSGLASFTKSLKKKKIYIYIIY